MGSVQSFEASPPKDRRRQTQRALAKSKDRNGNRRDHGPRSEHVAPPRNQDRAAIVSPRDLENTNVTPLTHKIIQDVAAEWGVNPALIAAKSRRKRVVCARVDAVKRMKAHGCTAYHIGKQLGYDHTTILYYLGNLKRHKPPLPEWRAPQVRHLCWIKQRKIPRGPASAGRYLIPYAGADWRQYRWIERPSLTEGLSDDRDRQSGERAAA